MKFLRLAGGALPADDRKGVLGTDSVCGRGGIGSALPQNIFALVTVTADREVTVAADITTCNPAATGNRTACGSHPHVAASNVVIADDALSHATSSA